MKTQVKVLVIVSLFFYGASAHSRDPQNASQRRQQQEVRQYSSALQIQGKLETLLKEAQLEFSIGHCNVAQVRKSQGCQEVAKNIATFRQKLSKQRETVRSLGSRLAPYLASASGLIEDIDLTLFNTRPVDEMGTGLSEYQLELTDEAATCSRSLELWTPQVYSLYSSAMLILKRHDRHRQLKQLKSIHAASSEDCQTSTQENCWRSEDGKYYYVAQGGIQVSEDCLILQDEKARENFPTNPSDYIVAVQSVAKAIKAGGCFSNLNPSNAQYLADYIKRRRPKVTCRPEQHSNKKVCASTYAHASSLTLIAPSLCGNLAGTIFHEILHIGGQIDNLATHNHNNLSCRSYDGVYHCEALCFADPYRTANFLHQTGCNQCVAESRQQRFCKHLPNTFDLNYQSCNSSEH